MNTLLSTKDAALWVAVAVIALGVAVGQARGQELPVTLEIGTDIVSKYVWRGQLLTDDPVVQPSATVALGGLSLNVWGSADTTDINEQGDSPTGPAYRFQEVDYTLSYALSPMDGLDLEAGVIYYDFPGTGLDGTNEVYASIGLSSLPLSPTLTAYHDFDELDDSVYVSFSIGHAFALTEKLELSVGAALGWGDADYHDAYFTYEDEADPTQSISAQESGFSDLSLSAGLSYAVNDHFGLALSVAYSEILDDVVESAADMTYGDSDLFTVAIGATFTF